LNSKGRAGQSPERPRPKGTEDLRTVGSLDRRSWRNWFLFLSVAIITTLGLATAIVTLLGGRIRTPWPWANTDLILLAGLSVAILVFAGYLTAQERQVVALRKELFRANEEAAEHMHRYYDRLVALLNVSRVLATETNPQAVFDSLTMTCVETFGCQQATLMLLNQATQTLEMRSVCGHDAAAEELARPQKVGRGVIGWVAEQRQPYTLGVGGSTAGAPVLGGTASPRAVMIVPIELREELIGILTISTSRPEVRYEDEDLQALQVFAETAGICCRHAEQTDWMRKTIQRLDAALQERGIADGNWAA
jgi:hypothetical protein